jgi:putative two-component system response regulator
MTGQEKYKILLLEDDVPVLMSLAKIMSAEGYLVHTYEDAVSALAGFHEIKPDAVVADVNMPGMNGMDFLEQIRSGDSATPVILMTGYEKQGMARDVVHLNVFEFLLKPFEPFKILDAIDKGIKANQELQFQKDYRDELEQAVVSRTFELENAAKVQKRLIREIIGRLTTAAEYRDEETGKHISRIGLYANRLAQSLGLSADFIGNITVAAPMHDIGKIGIPDSILFKPAPLTREEFQIIKTHTVIGERILKGSSHSLIQMAASIALTHHERWNGTGYPYGLSGNDIPLAGRIVMLADHYDALRSRRPYKEAFDHDRAVAIITQGDGKIKPEFYDPELLQAFKKTNYLWADIFEHMQDDDSDTTGNS